MFFFFFQAEDGIRDLIVTGVQTCALPIFRLHALAERLEVVRAGKRGGSDGSAVVRVTGDRAGGLVSATRGRDPNCDHQGQATPPPTSSVCHPTVLRDVSLVTSLRDVVARRLSAFRRQLRVPD